MFSHQVSTTLQCRISASAHNRQIVHISLCAYIVTGQGERAKRLNIHQF